MTTSLPLPLLVHQGTYFPTASACAMRATSRNALLPTVNFVLT